MATTGERYAAARRQLIEQSAGPRSREWVSPPEMGDDAVRAGTGRGWDEWCDLIEGWQAERAAGNGSAEHAGHDHPAVVEFVHTQADITGWWAQMVTVGYERITGIRLPYQRPDGTFTAGKSATVTVDPDELRALLLDDDGRTELFPGYNTELRSRPTSKNVRIAIGDGVAEIDVAPRDDGRAKITVAHDKLPSVASVEEWKFYWADWLAAIDADSDTS